MKPTEMNGHTGDNEIGTPDDLFAWLNKRFAFTFDAFATMNNALCKKFATKDWGVWADLNASFPISEDNGLTFSWAGESVFWNPPYGVQEDVCDPATCALKRCVKRGRHTSVYVPGYTEFIEKAISERNNVSNSVGLLKYDASTENGRLIRENFHIEYLPRIQYKGMTAAAPFSSVIAINRPDRYTPGKGN